MTVDNTKVKKKREKKVASEVTFSLRNMTWKPHEGFQGRTLKTVLATAAINASYPASKRTFCARD